MTFRVERSLPARRDLISIWGHVASEASSRTADRLVRRIERQFEALAAAPLIGRQRREWTGEPRCLPIAPYLVIYRPLPDKAGVLILRVLHSARDIDGLMAAAASDQ